jgi:hypothetical protein
MQTIKKLYRKDYRGEDVITNRVYQNSKWNPTIEFIPTESLLTLESESAVVLGNGPTRLEFDCTRFLDHRVPSQQWRSKNNKVNFLTYGCNAFFRDYKPDFLIATGDRLLREIADSGYCDSRIVYANNEPLVNFPGKFNLIPQNPQFNSGAIAVYLAAFDGHKKVYMLGFDGNDTPNYNYNVYNGTTGYPSTNSDILEDFWVLSLKQVMSAYNETEFVRVAPTVSFRTPEAWKYCLNYRQIDFRQFASEVGL